MLRFSMSHTVPLDRPEGGRTLSMHKETERLKDFAGGSTVEPVFNPAF